MTWAEDGANVARVTRTKRRPLRPRPYRDYGLVGREGHARIVALLGHLRFGGTVATSELALATTAFDASRARFALRCDRDGLPKRRPCGEAPRRRWDRRDGLLLRRPDRRRVRFRGLSALGRPAALLRMACPAGRVHLGRPLGMQGLLDRVGSIGHGVLLQRRGCPDPGCRSRSRVPQ